MKVKHLIETLQKLKPIQQKQLEVVVTRAIEPGHMRRIVSASPPMGCFKRPPERIFIHEDDWRAAVKEMESWMFRAETPNIKATVLGVPVIFDPTCNRK